VKGASDLDAAANERADIELDRLITKRYDPRDGEALLEPTCADTVMRHDARRQEENRSERGSFHEKMAQLHAWLNQEHAAKAAKLYEEDRGEGSC